MQESNSTAMAAMEEEKEEEAMAERLSSLDNLYFPRSIQPSAATPSQRKPILLDLLRRDPAVFLERYGGRLTAEELREFEAKSGGDYEVNWHLDRLRSAESPTSRRSAVVKNRRRAYMSRLEREGSYFSEEAMREREPYLHHEYLGRFQDVSGRGMARPGERWSETLLRRCEEAVLVEKIRAEQMRLGVDEKDWVGNARAEEEEEEEEEEDEEEEKEGACHSEVNPNGANNGRAGEETHQKTRLSEAEMQDQMENFTYIMQQKFLSGEDTEHLDYSKIDNDETLDDHWLREANLDAEDKYFSED